jgi:hypothetical protein
MAAWIALGCILLGGVIAAPRVFYPAVWLSVVLVLDPVNHLLGQPSICDRLGRGEWRIIVVLGCAALICGFFWEMWNYHSVPKWVYHVPYFGRGEVLEVSRLFEMPLLGYLGYVPFGAELYALYQFLSLLAGRDHAVDLPFAAEVAAARSA